MPKDNQVESDEDQNSSGDESEVNYDAGQGNPEKDGSEETEAKAKQKKRKVHRLTLTETENFNEKLRKRGVIYIARIPPRMTPTKIKSLLSEFGEVTRVYLVEEDPTVRKRRKKEHGSSGGKRYIEGWVEFANKRKAKHIAASLNNTPISNHKRNPHYGTKCRYIGPHLTIACTQQALTLCHLCLGDLWNLKYLSKFKWSHLTEKVAYERRVREQKLRIEMMHARRENAAYVQMVETGKKLDKIEERKRKRGGKDGPNDTKKRRHRQLKPVDGFDKAAKSAVLHSARLLTNGTMPSPSSLKALAMSSGSLSSTVIM
eukprot:scaffold23496_cov188-Cylindrotheca_fusiformis.AAC.3